MRKIASFVTRGTPTSLPRPLVHSVHKDLDEVVEDVSEFTPAISSASAPADLPRDWGVTADGHAIEVRKIDRAIHQSFEHLAEVLEGEPEAAVRMAVDESVKGEQRKAVSIVFFRPPILTISLQKTTDSFLLKRKLLSDLQRSLQPRFGKLKISFIQE